MNNIATIQNESNQLQKLAAQRQIYAIVKTIIGYQFIFSGPVTILFMLLALFFPECKVYVALWGVLLFLLDILFLSKWQKDLKAKAALIQEKFDCEVLSIPWNSLKIKDGIDHELIKNYSDKYNKSNTNMPTVRDWYPVSVNELPLTLGRIVCQRSNCWWDSSQRRSYANFLALSLLVVVFSMLLIGVLNHLTLEDFLLIIAVPTMPVITLVARQFSEHKEAADRLDKLREYTDKLWSDALNQADSASFLNKSRNLQDEIFEGRKRNPPVFDWIFKHLRNEHEDQMNHCSDLLVEEARARAVKS